MQDLRWLLLVAVLAGMGAATAQPSGIAPPEHQKPPNIVLITLDATRADRMGFLGSNRGLTPNLDSLARQSVVFTRAYSQVPLTTPSHAALLTGTYPTFNHLSLLHDPLREDLPYVPDLLQKHGYHTAAFVGSMILDPSGGAPGFDRGFEFYDAGYHLARPGEDRYHSLERRAEDVANHALGWLSHNQEGPFFVWLHFFDPHDPYDPPPPYKARYKSTPYDGEIAYTDSVVGRVLDALKRQGLFENSLIVVAADHGEAFGEHGERKHGLLLYDETIHVPLVLKLPGERFAGERVDTRVALADVAPSLLQAAGIVAPASMQSESFFSSIDGSKAPERAIYSETDYAHRTLGWSELRSWRTGKYLYVQAPRRELYDETSDPQALKNIAPTAKAVSDTLDAQLSEFRQKTKPGGTEKVAINSAQDESLQALGYLSSDGAKENRIEKPLVDPKDKVEIVNQLQEALVDVEENRYADATARVNDVVRDPDAVNAYLEFGTLMVRHKQYRDAVPLLRTAVKKLPDSAAAHYDLGIALMNTGQWEAALPEMQAAVALRPDSASLHFDLAAVNTRLRRVPEAEAEFRKSLEIDPDYFEANLNYGKLLMQQGRLDAALSSLSHAVEVKPESAEAHFFLAEAYQKLGQPESASRERDIVRELSAHTPE